MESSDIVTLVFLTPFILYAALTLLYLVTSAICLLQVWWTARKLAHRHNETGEQYGYFGVLSHVKRELGRDDTTNTERGVASRTYKKARNTDS